MCVYTHLIFHSTMTKLLRHLCIELIVCAVRLYCTVQAVSFHSPRPPSCIKKNENKEAVPQGWLICFVCSPNHFQIIFILLG